MRLHGFTWQGFFVGLAITGVLIAVFNFIR